MALPGRHSFRASVLRADLYSEILSTYLQSRLRVHKTEKKGDSNIPMWNGRARAVLWRRRIGQVVGRVGWRCIWSNLGVPGSAHTGTLQWGLRQGEQHLRRSLWKRKLGVQPSLLEACALMLQLRSSVMK